MTGREHITVSHDDPGAMHYRARNAGANDDSNVGPACSPARVREGGMGVTDDPDAVTCSICDSREARNLRASRELSRQLATLAGHLPADDGAWKVDTEHADYGDRAPHLVRDDGVTLWAHVVQYGSGAGRLELSAGVPEGADYSAGDTRDKRPSVTVDPTRPAHVIGRDIGRRLIPAAVTYWQTVTARIAARQARKGAAEGLAEALAGLMSSSAREGRDGREWYANTPRAAGSSGHFTTYDGQTVTLEIHGMPADRARELAAVIAGWKR
jgi:hypothetical protein